VRQRQGGEREGERERAREGASKQASESEGEIKRKRASEIVGGGKGKGRREEGWKEGERCGLPRELAMSLNLPRELAMSLNRATQPGPVSPGGGEQAQRHKPASLSSESGESLRHVGCYPTVVGGEAG